MNLDFTKFENPISEDFPCGENLEDMTEFYILEDLVKGEPETQFSEYIPPDWKEVKKLSLQLLATGKNLWVLTFLLYSLTCLGGLKGIHAGLTLIYKLITLYWNDLQPLLDNVDDEDYTRSRLAPLLTLSAKDGIFFSNLKEIPLIETIHLGTFSFKDLECIKEKDTANNPKYANLDLTVVSCDVKSESISTAIEKLKECVSTVEDIDDFITSQTGNIHNISKLNELAAIFYDLIDFLNNNISPAPTDEDMVLETENNTEVSVVENNQKTINKQNTRLINNHSDIILLCDEICRWYEKNEPSSPVPYFIRRARGLVGKEFMDIVNNLIDDASGRLNYLFGIDKINYPENNGADFDYDDE